MLGAIIGDIVGSRFEFHNHRSKKFNLFTKQNFYTDDTVCTCAVASALLKLNRFKKNINNREEMIAIQELQNFCRVNTGRGYGGSFYEWIYLDNPGPYGYGSWGNGGPMRVSPVGWIAKSEEEVKYLSNLVTGITHNHPYALKAAEVVSMCVYYLRNGKDKDFVREYVEKEYPVIKTLDYEQLKKIYTFNERAIGTTPQAIYCFLISNSFEDCLRTTVSIGGDTDTLCAISCAIAEAYYGVPEQFKQEILQYFTPLQQCLLLKPLNEIAKKSGIDNYIVLQ